MTLPRTAMITPLDSVRNNIVSENGNAYKDELARRIAEGVDACVARGMSREDISREMGYRTKGSLSKWATGAQTPESENLGKLAMATGLSLDWLIAERGPMFAPAGEESVRLTVIGRVVNGDIPDQVVRWLSREDGGALGAALIALRGPGDSE